MMRKSLCGVSLALACAALSAESVTLPAAASIVGGSPFFSDVRAFNTSYTSSLTVTATYRCFIGSPCPGIAPQTTFTLGPRESRAFDNIVVSAFNAPDTAGGVEFDYSGSGGQLVVTSRLYSTAPVPTVGMFIPGLDNSEADPVTVLTSIRNLGPGEGFRTNVGVFNREDSPANVTFSIFDGNGAAVGAPVTRTVGGHSGLQLSRIFTFAGVPDFVTDNAVIVVSASGEVFSYAAVIDNATTDPIFVVGAEDQPPQPITPAATSTRTPTSPGPTATRTPTATPTQPAGGIRIVNVGQGGMNFRDTVTGTSTSTIPVGTTISWVWVNGLHSTVSGSCPSGNCTPNGIWQSTEDSGITFDHTFATAGTFPYYCSVHGSPMQGTVIVN